MYNDSIFVNSHIKVDIVQCVDSYYYWFLVNWSIFPDLLRLGWVPKSGQVCSDCWRRTYTADALVITGDKALY